MRAWATLASLVVVSAFARAAGAGPAETGVVSLRDLPEGRLSTVPPPAKAPAHVAAREKVPGIVLARLPGDRRGPVGANAGYSYLFSNAEEAKAFSKGSGIDQTRMDSCFVDGLDVASANDDGEPSVDAAAEWPSSLSASLPLNYDLPSGQNPHGRGIVRPVHVEKLVRDAAGKVTLETTDAWVDAVTLGVRLIGRSTVPLARIAVTPAGFEVYGARSGSDVLVVVRTVDHELPDAAATARLRETTRSMQLVLPGNQAMSSECGLAHFTLHGQKGTGQMATVQGVAVLPALDGDKAETAPSKLPKGATDDPEMVTERMLEGLRFRSLRANVSTSQTSVDRDPLISVAFGWNGKAAQQPQAME